MAGVVLYLATLPVIHFDAVIRRTGQWEETGASPIEFVSAIWAALASIVGIDTALLGTAVFTLTGAVSGLLVRLAIGPGKDPD